MRMHLVQAHAMLKLRMLSTPGLHLDMDDATATMVVKLLADEMTESELQVTGKILDFSYKHPFTRHGPAENVLSRGELDVASIKYALDGVEDFVHEWKSYPDYTPSKLEIARAKELLQELLRDLLRMFDEEPN